MSQTNDTIQSNSGMEIEQSNDQIVDRKDLTRLNHALNVGYEAIEFKIKTLNELLPVLYEAREMTWNDEEAFQRNETEIKDVLEDIDSLEYMIKSRDQLMTISEKLQPNAKPQSRLDEDLEKIIIKFDLAVDQVISGYEGWISSLNSIDSKSKKTIETRKLRVNELMASIEYFQECKDLGLRDTITLIRKNSGADFLTWVYYLKPSDEEILEAIDKLSGSNPAPDHTELVLRKLIGNHLDTKTKLDESGIEFQGKNGIEYNWEYSGKGNNCHDGRLDLTFRLSKFSQDIANDLFDFTDEIGENILIQILNKINNTSKKVINE